MEKEIELNDTGWRILSLMVLVAMIGLTCSHLKDIPAAEVVLKNGYIYTCNPAMPRVTALAIAKGRIIFAGGEQEVGAFVGAKTQVIDLQKQMVLPGFIDSHCHAITSFRQFYEVNLYNTHTASAIEEVIRRFLSDHPGLTFVRGRGWSNTDFPPAGPDKKVLDRVTGILPARFSSEDGHSVWVNSKALELAHITAAAPDPAGGVIERYAGTHEPSGTLRENAADLIQGIFPDYTVEELEKGLSAYQTMALGFGITTAHDAYLDAGSRETTAFRNLEKNGQLRMRFRASLYVDPDRDPRQLKVLLQEREKNRGKLFQTNTAKLFVDGVVEGRTALLKQPYEQQPGFFGERLWHPDSLKRMCAELDRLGFQIHVHSIGDAATAMTLDALQFAAEANGRRDSRHLITHLQLVDPSDILRFSRLGVIAVAQPYWFMKDDYYYNLQVPYLGQKRADEEYPMASFFKAGVMVASSSDYPVTIPCNPLQAIQIGITRSMPGKNDPLWPQESASLEQMIASFTINGAYANFLEKETGSIEKGKSADLIVLNRDLFEIPATEIREVKVVSTFFCGKKVF